MSKNAPWIIFALLLVVLLLVSALKPSLLSDSGNSFLKDFLDNDILSVLGFITAVGNASILSIFLHLNKLEDETEAKFIRSRRSLKKSAVSLIVVFLIVFFVLIAKPMLGRGETLAACLNSIGILCVFFSLSVLRDVTLTVFSIPTARRIAEVAAKNREDSSSEQAEGG